MKIASLLFGLALVGSGALAGAQDEPEWRPLFNGKDLTGWTVEAKTADRGKDFWKVQEGSIMADSLGHTDHDYVWLVTTEEFSDFDLRLKFQAFRDSPGNSGVQVRSRYDSEAGWLDGPQVDIHPPGPWRTGMVWDETRGSQWWLWPPVPRGKWVDESMVMAKAPFYFSTDATAWNEFEIRARGTQLEAVLNGVTVMRHDGAGLLDDENHRARRVGMRGHIALQIHKSDSLRIRFKEIEIRH